MFAAGLPIETAAAGGQLANINVWDRVIPIEYMNKLLWNGNLFNMLPEQITVVSGNLHSATLGFNVSGMYNIVHIHCHP